MRQKLGEFSLLLALCLAIGGFYVWTARSNGENWKFGREQNDYYNLLIDGWLAGQLHMKVDVPAELLRIKDPYDPAQRPPGVGLHDASFYRGKYYIYFGLTPGVTLMLPWRVLTGVDLPQPVAVLVFALGGFAASAFAWLQVRRRYFPDAGTGVALLGLLAIGIAGLGPVLVRRPAIWELPIAAGYCFAMLALLCLYQSLHARRATGWFAAAGLCLGLAIASRAVYLFGLGAMLVPLVAWWRESRQLPWRRTFAGLVPLAVIGLALAAHNYARFGDPLEFGQKYQLTSMHEAKLTHFAARYVPFNAWLYFWSPAEWSRYFPFIAVDKSAVGPAGHGGREDVYGLLRNLPLAWLALLAPLALRRRSDGERAALGAWLLTVVALVAPVAMLLLFFFGAHGRYMLDFAPSVLLLAVIGVLALERESTGWHRGWRWLVRAGWGGATIVSVVFALLFSLTATQLLREKNPGRFEALARALNHIPAAFERLAGTIYGPVLLEVRFAPAAPGTRQTLLTTNRGERRDAVFVQHGDQGTIQLGCAHETGGTALSRPFPIDFNAMHRLRISLGSFYPPPTHPMLAKLPAAAASRLKRQLVLELDGEIVLETEQDFHLASPDSIRIAPDLNNNVLGHRFTGQIGRVTRERSAPPADDPANARYFRFRLELPTTGEPTQPLLAFGAPGAGAVLAYRTGGAGGGRFAWLAEGGAPLESAAFAPERRQVHELLVRVTQLGTSGVALQVQVDGMLVWSRRTPTALPASPAIVVARNTPALVGCAEIFAARIHQFEAFGENADPLVIGRGALRVKLRFPRPPLQGRDPLLVTGRAGTGDFFVIDYATPGAVQFGVDHWGNSRMPQSPPLPVDFETVHEVEVSLGATPGPPENFAVHANWNDRVVVRLDGREVWAESISIYQPGRGEVYVGRNPIGGSSCGVAFRGEIFFAERVLPPHPAANAPARN